MKRSIFTILIVIPRSPLRSSSVPRAIVSHGVKKQFIKFKSQKHPIFDPVPARLQRVGQDIGNTAPTYNGNRFMSANDLNNSNHQKYSFADDLVMNLNIKN